MFLLKFKSTNIYDIIFKRITKNNYKYYRTKTIIYSNSITFNLYLFINIWTFIYDNKLLPILNLI